MTVVVYPQTLEIHLWSSSPDASHHSAGTKTIFNTQAILSNFDMHPAEDVSPAWYMSVIHTCKNVVRALRIWTEVLTIFEHRCVIK